MIRPRTAAAASLLLIPMVAGGFFLQEAPVRTAPRLFDQVLSLVANRYVDSLQGSAIFEKAAHGLVRELNDPYSELLAPKQNDEFSRSVGGRYGGVGMLLEEQKTTSASSVVVSRIFPNTPAEEGGVREGDRIVQVDALSTVDAKIEKVSDALRGVAGTIVQVTFARPGVLEPVKLSFKRAVIHVPAVPFSTMLGDKIGYIPLQTFNENTADEVQTAAAKLVADGARGIVLDLRDNGGGIVEQALAVSSLFLKSGQSIVDVRSRNASDEVARASSEQLASQPPMVVLTDGGTASASEIVAGALQDHDRALVLGTTSFGKGLVQSVFPLDGGYALKITTAKWYTPSGRSIHRERKLLADGRFVEVAPDSLETEAEKKARPTFSSDAGRTVYGGGGITPRPHRPRRHALDERAGVPPLDGAEGAGVRHGVEPVRVRAQVYGDSDVRRDAGVAHGAPSSTRCRGDRDRAQVRASRHGDARPRARSTCVASAAWRRGSEAARPRRRSSARARCGAAEQHTLAGRAVRRGTRRVGDDEGERVAGQEPALTSPTP